MRPILKIPMIPDQDKFTKAEWKIIEKCRTPRQVQQYLKTLAYNKAETILSFRQVVAQKAAHCLEGALAAAVILEQHGYPPLIMSLESVDNLDHVIYVFKTKTGWGSIGKSRDTGLHGRKPVFRSARDLALSYFDPYVDRTGRITGYKVVDMAEFGRFDWRFNAKKLTKVEDGLIDHDHHPIISSERRYQSLRKRFIEFKEKYPNRQVTYFDNRDTWL